MPNAHTLSPEDILTSLKVNPHPNVYFIGTPNRGVTIYKQQVRALNLIYSLQNLGKIKKGSKISIIGGGISGITASAASLSIGCKVILYEKKPFLVHLQTGCKIRWVHPHIYDWPEEGSRSPYAGLPILNWKEGYASDMAQELLKEYRRLTSHHSNDYLEFLGSGFTINFPDNNIDQHASLNYNDINSQYDYDILIIASGFGLELGVLTKDILSIENTVSYWRNDDLDQPFLGFDDLKKKTVVVSGTGDGALIDILRATLINFHQGRLIDEILYYCPDKEKLEHLISSIKSAYVSTKSNNSAWLNHEFSYLPKELLTPIKEYLRSQYRIDTNVILLGKQPKMYDVFNLQKMSVFNAFIVHLLYNMKLFQYYGVKSISPIKTKRNRINIKFLRANQGKVDEFINYDVFISRHGHRKGIEEVLREMGVSDFKFNNTNDTSERIWEPGWPSYSFESFKEFVPPATRNITTTFIETLSNYLLNKHKGKNPSFRLTYERFTEIRGTTFFQQVSRYAGTSASGSSRTVNRIFPAQYGIVGLAAMLGKSVLLIRGSDFGKIVDFMETNKLQANNIRTQLNSMLCIPIFSPIINSNELHINSAIYIDSSEIDFFSEDVIEVTVNLCQGFINHLEKMKLNREIITLNTAYKGIRVEPFDGIIPQNDSLRIGDEIMIGMNDNRLVFQTISSFDIYEQDFYVSDTNV